MTVRTPEATDRRTEVADAAMRVIAREGIDRASVRAVAHELGATTGVISHYFRDKDELMLFVLDRVLERTREQLLDTDGEPGGLERLEYLMHSVLPRRGEDDLGWRVWVAFVGHAVGRPHLLAAHARRYDALRDLLRGELEDLERQGLLRAGLDLDAEVHALIAFADGLGIAHVVSGTTLNEGARRETVRRYLRGAFAVPRTP